MVSVIFKFRDAEGRAVNVTVDGANPLMDPEDLIDAANAIAAVTEFQPLGAPLATLLSATVAEVILTELEV
jgi:hypothetical protein